MKITRQIACVGLFLLILTGATYAAEEQAPAPVIEIEEATYEFGEVQQGEEVKHTFKVFNRGNAPLEIKNVKPG